MGLIARGGDILRITFFTDTYWPQVNGVTRTLERKIKFLNIRGHETVIFAPADPRGKPGGRVYTFPGVPVPFYGEMRIGLPWSGHLRSILEDFQPQVVHLVTEYTIGYTGLRWSRKLGVPAVASYHTDIPQYLAYYHFPFLSETAWKYLVWFHNQCQINFCPSEAARRELAQRGISRLAVYGRGVDGELFHPGRRSESVRQRYAPGTRIILLYAGRLAAEKNIGVLLEAFTMVRSAYSDVTLVLAGDGPLAPALARQQPAGVVLAGQLASEELAQLYASSDLFVFPSTTETFGNVVLEAMASGLPVVAPLAGGISENLQPGVNGLACPPDDPQALADKVLGLLADPGERQRLGQAARRYAEGRSWDRALAPLLAGYEAVVAEVEAAG